MKNPSHPDISKFWNSIFEENQVPKRGICGIIIVEQPASKGCFKHFFNLNEILKEEVPQFCSETPVTAIDEIRNKTYKLQFITKIEGIEEVETNVFSPNINISIQDAEKQPKQNKYS